MSYLNYKNYISCISYMSFMSRYVMNYVKSLKIT